MLLQPSASNVAPYSTGRLKKHQRQTDMTEWYAEDGKESRARVRESQHWSGWREPTKDSF